MREWRTSSQVAAKSHRETGVSLVLLHTAEDALELFKGTWFEPLPGVERKVEGKVLREKRDIRIFIGDNVTNPVMREPGAALWTSFDEENGVSYVGLGRLHPEKPEGVECVQVGGDS